MNQSRNRERDVPRRQSNTEHAEGTQIDEHGRGSEGERNRLDSDSRHRNSGGITNRPLDRERCEQERLPERGQSQSDR